LPQNRCHEIGDAKPEIIDLENSGEETKQMTLGTMFIALVIGMIASLIGGVIGGIAVGGKHIGNQLAAMMGGFFGPIAGIWGVIAGLAALYVMAILGV